MKKTIKQKIRENKFYQNHIKKYWGAATIRQKYLLNLVLHGTIFVRKFNSISSKKIVYLTNNKVACTSIRSSLYDVNLSIHEIANKNAIHSLKSKTIDYETFFKFTYVRNPFERLVSCYKNNLGEGKWFGINYLEYLRNVKDFDIFIEKVCKIPISLMDQHFYPQYNLIYDKKGKCRVDYVGKFEDLPNDYNEKIADVYDVKHLRHYNKTDQSKRWEDYYTVETANLVHEKYKKDFEVFGYEESYTYLIDYLTSKQS